MKHNYFNTAGIRQEVKENSSWFALYQRTLSRKKVGSFALLQSLWLTGLKNPFLVTAHDVMQTATHDSLVHDVTDSDFRTQHGGLVHDVTDTDFQTQHASLVHDVTDTDFQTTTWRRSQLCFHDIETTY